MEKLLYVKDFNTCIIRPMLSYRKGNIKFFKNDQRRRFRCLWHAENALYYDFERG